jgi:signal transduction histidine kinase/HAMP domain-containing protein
MKTRFSASLRLKVTVGVLLPLVIVWSSLAYIRHINYQRRLMESVHTTAANTGEIIEGSLQHAMLNNDFSQVEQVVAGIGNQPGVRALFLLDKGGRVMIATEDSILGHEIDIADPTCQACHQYEAASRNESVILSPDQGARVFRNVNAIENTASCIACHDADEQVLGVLITDLDMSTIDRTLAIDSRHTLWWSIGSGTLMGVVINLLMSGMVIRRVEQLVKAIRRVDEGDLDVKVTSHSKDELGQLASSFNQMVGGLRDKEALESSLREQTKALQDQTERLSALNTIAATVSQSLDLEDILDSALSKIGDLIDVQTSWVVLRSDQSDRFEFAAGHGLPEGISPSNVLCMWDRSSCSEVFDLGESRVLRDPVSSGCPMAEHFRDEGLDARVCVPLQSKHRVLGVMSLVGSADDGPFTLSGDALDMLNSIGRQMGVAIENARLYEELRREEELRRHLLERLITVQEEERKRIALELHDQTGQVLTSLIMTLGAVGEAASLSQVRAYLPDLRDTAAQVLREIHDLALELRPSLLDDLGLLSALRHLHKGFEDRFHLPVDFQVLGLDGDRLPPKVETALYRIVQEALTNVARHAEAEHVSVLLEVRGTAGGHNQTLKLIVEDDGKGFDVPAATVAHSRERLGLYSMRERASLLGGTLTIESSPGTGTAIFVEVPLEEREQAVGSLAG